MGKRLIDANALLAEMDKFANPMPNQSGHNFLCGISTAITEIEDAPTVDAVPVETVAEMFEYFLGDCPCNYSPTDVWLSECCELQEECPYPADEHGCWKQFIKHWGERREGE
jgi:hypothetical protein